MNMFSNNLVLQEIQLNERGELYKKIDSITDYSSKPYFRQALKNLGVVNPENANIIAFTSFFLGYIYSKMVTFGM